MQVLRTPEDRFEGLADHDPVPHYAEVTDDQGPAVRMHFLDEGPPDGAPVLLMHGEPTWSFLYRHMIPVLVEAGHRCIAPDLIGFGRSDKPASVDDHTYARHVAWTRDLVETHLDLNGITLCCQDWGGLIGLRLVAADPDRYARVVVANTGLPTGDQPMTEAFSRWQRFSREVDEMPVGRIIDGGTTTELAPEVIAAYDAPFPDETYKAGVRILPSLVPTAPDDPARADQLEAWEVLERFERPFLCAFGDSDAITAGGERVFLDRVPGTRGQAHTTIAGAGHFLQEDRGPELAQVIVELIAATT